MAFSSFLLQTILPIVQLQFSFHFFSFVISSTFIFYFSRQFEGLIRLTQARARLELSNEATLEHALDVLAIVRYSLVDVFSTDDGELHVTRNINGGGMSQATQAKKFIRALREHSSAIEKTLFEVKELRQIAADIGIVSTDFTRLIDSLNLQGIILKKGPNIYKFCSE